MAAMLATARVASAAESAPGSQGIVPAGVTESSPADGLAPKRLVWPGIAIIVIIAIFVTAALTGPLIRANTDDDAEAPPESSDKTE